MTKGLTNENMIKKIIVKFSKIFGVSFQSHEITIVSIVNEILDKINIRIVEDNKTDKNDKMVKGMDLYILALTLGCSLIIMQLSVPDIKTSKSIPGCLKSFSGFPFSGDTSSFDGLNYIVCGVKGFKTSSRPFTSLKKVKKEYILEKFKVIIEKHLVNHLKVLEMKEIKDEYEMNKALNIDSQEIYKTTLQKFRPSLSSIVLENEPGATARIFDSINLAISNKSKEQYTLLKQVQSQLMFLSFGIEHSHNKIVSNSTPTLVSSQNVPFLQNACCNDSSVDTYDYFVSNDQSIDLHNKRISVFYNKLMEYREIRKASTSVISTNDNIYGALPFDNNKPHTMSLENMYNYFIDKCDLENIYDKTIPGTEAYKAEVELMILRNQELTRDDLIERIKELPVFSTFETFQQFIQAVQQNTLFPVNTLKEITEEDVFEDDTEIDEFLYEVHEVVVESVKNKEYMTIHHMLNDQIRLIRDNLSGKDAKLIPIITQLNTLLSSSNISHDERLHYKLNIFYKLHNLLPNIILNRVSFNDLNLTSSDKKSIERSTSHIGAITAIMQKEFHSFENFYNISEFDKIYASGYDMRTMEGIHRIIELLSESRLENDPKVKNIDMLFMDTMIIYSLEKFIRKINAIMNLDELHMGKYYALIDMVVDKLKVTVKNVIMSPSDVEERVLISKDKEKSKIVKMLGDMSIEKRRVENMLKNNKLGRWAAGLEAGLFKYQPERYEREMKDFDDDIEVPVIGDLENVPILNRETMDELERRNLDNDPFKYSDLFNNEENEREVFDMNMIPDDDDYGDVDSDYYMP